MIHGEMIDDTWCNPLNLGDNRIHARQVRIKPRSINEKKNDDGFITSVLSCWSISMNEIFISVWYSTSLPNLRGTPFKNILALTKAIRKL